ncbi:translocase of chloroplast 120, chloroplastic [Silene latifolia]|uniref:translocase of chloroplast 120, chloroplastic n=1 Tax=Silene latifolia TaxID=37657 RepID=UPI003D76DCEC
MENGVKDVEEIQEVEVKGVDDRLTVEERVVVVGGAHLHKVSEGDDVFEEAMELALDDGVDEADGLKSVHVSDHGESVSDHSVAKGSSSLVEGFSDGRDGVEVRDESFPANSDEGSITDVNDYESVPHEEVSSVDERVLHQDLGATEESHGREIEAEVLIVEETKVKVVDGEEDMVEKSIVMETSVSRDFEERVDDNAAARDVEVVEDNGDVNHGREIGSGLEDSPSIIGSQGQSEKFEEVKEAMIGESEDHCNSSDHQDHAGAAFEDALGDIESEVQGDIVEPEGEEKLLPSQHRNVDDSSSEISVSVDSRSLASNKESLASVVSTLGKDKVEDKSIASDFGEHGSSNGQLQSSGNDGHAIEGKLMQEVKQNSEASKEKEAAVKTAQPSISSSGKSANPTPSPARPAGLGRAAPLLEPSPKAAQQPRANGQASQVQTHLVEDSTNSDVEEGDEIREKLQMIRVKFLRLAYRLGQTPHNVVVAQVLYRLGLAEQLRARNGGRVGAFSFDRASAMAEQLEAAGQGPLDFSCTIMVIGKTGVGKSATINSIFDEVKFGTDAFHTSTKKVQDVVGTVQGIKVRVIDTPGLLSSISDQRQNEKILHSVKRFISKSPPDIVLYLDRLDMPSRDFGDTPLLRTITDVFGPSIWFNAIVVLTHAASAPPDGPNGTPSTYDLFVTQRSHAVQQAIRQAAGDMRLMNPVSLVENHLACRTNRAGQRVLPNGQVWKPHLLLLSFASKILAEANIILKLQDSPPGKPFAARSRAPPLPFLLSSLLQSRPQLKLPEEQYADDEAMDYDLDESSESDGESEFDELPPFKPLTKAQLSKLTKAQRKAYYDELEYREKLFMKKQLKEERKRRKMMKKMAAEVNDIASDYTENVEGDSGGAATLPVPMPDLALPASFDSDNPTHRYRYLDTSNQWLVRPVLDNHGWDHDVGYEGINVERMFVVKDKVPLSFSGQVSKDKKEANLQMEMASSIKHGEGKATTLGFDMQSVGKDMAYTLRSETRFSNYRRNKATAGLSATLLGDALSAGLKVEDKLILNKQLRVVMSGGAMASRGDIAYGGSLEATLRDKDYPLGRFLSTLGLSVMDWHGELALGCNVQSQIPIGRHTNLVARANLNNRGSGQIGLRLNSSEQLQLALIGLLPLIKKLMQRQEHPLGY